MKVLMLLEAGVPGKEQLGFFVAGTCCVLVRDGRAAVGSGAVDLPGRLGPALRLAWDSSAAAEVADPSGAGIEEHLGEEIELGEIATAGEDSLGLPSGAAAGTAAAIARMEACTEVPEAAFPNYLAPSMQNIQAEDKPAAASHTPEHSCTPGPPAPSYVVYDPEVR